MSAQPAQRGEPAQGHFERYPSGLAVCPGSGQRTRRPASYSGDEPDRCPVCDRVAYVCLDGTTGKHPERVAR